MTKDPLRRSRRLKRNRFFKRLILTGGAFLLIYALGVGFFNLPYFSLASVSLEGARTLPSEEITRIIDEHLQKKSWGFFPHDNFFVFLLTAQNIEDALTAKIPKIKSVTIKKRFPHGITASIEERKIWATLCKESSCFYIDKEGFLFGKSSRVSGSIFFAIKDERNTKADIGSSVISTEELSTIRHLLEKIEETTGASFAALVLSGSENLISKYEAKTDAGWRIIFDSKTNSNLAIANFIAAYEGILQKNLEHIDYVDLRLENKIFYKYK